MSKVNIWWLLLLAGCFSREPYVPVVYYTIDVHPSCAKVEQVQPVSLGIRQFNSTSRYKDQVLYRDAAQRIHYEEIDRWVEPPAEMLTRLFLHGLRSARVFQTVGLVENLKSAALLLDGDLIYFDVVDPGPNQRVACTLLLEIRDAKEEQVIWSQEFAGTAALGATSSVGEAMNGVVQQILAQAIEAMSTASLAR